MFLALGHTPRFLRGRVMHLTSKPAWTASKHLRKGFLGVSTNRWVMPLSRVFVRIRTS
jgi:hypothetical protein